MKRFFFVLCSIVLVMAACATATGNVTGVQDITGGIGIVVDASVVNKNTIGRDDFSMPDNRAIATLAGSAAADALARKGYTTAGPVVTIAGARLDAKDKYAVTDMEGKKIEAPEAIQPPFMVEPAIPDTARANIGPLFKSLYTTPGSVSKQLSTVNPAHLDVAEGGGAILAVICAGRIPSGGSRAAAIGTAFVAVIAATAGASTDVKGEVRTQSTAEIYLIDRRNGATLWHDAVEAHDVSPAFFADAVGKMLEKLPPPRNP
ncbi:MAG: hypothetical protein HZA03_11730 [Nitrospinae bacterium]|nr:hypothetical protein [Nitrospinota bacterium]